MGSAFSLPASLLSSEIYDALGEEERKALVAKLCYCEEIAESAASASKVEDSDLLDAIDDIELDALSIMRGFSGIDRAISPYQIHSSWTLDCDRQVMAGYVVPSAADFLASVRIGVNVSSDDARSWLQMWAEVLHLTLNRFGSASSFTEAVTHLVVVDALVSSYLVFAATARLSGGVL